VSGDARILAAGGFRIHAEQLGVDVQHFHRLLAAHVARIGAEELIKCPGVRFLLHVSASR
jgi:hypothetical protein